MDTSRLVTSSSTTSLDAKKVNEDGDDGEEVKYIVYKKRWLVLFIATFSGFTADIIWVSFSPVATVAAEFYDVSVDTINLVSLIHIILPIVFGFVASWLLDVYGLKPSLLIAAWVTLIGSVLRSVSTLDFIPHSWAFPMVLTGQTIAATVAPICDVCTTKVSEQWFGHNQRSLSTMLISASYGLTLANILTPFVVKTKGIKFMFILYSVFPLFGALITTFGMTSSKPPTPPSPSAAVEMQPFWTGMKQILRNRQFLILLVLLSMESALFNSLTVMAEEMLCTHGYDPTFSGLVMGIQSGVGVIGALLASLYVDRTKLFDETTKVLYALSAISMTMMMTVSCIPHMEALILITNILYGVFSSGAFPVALELTIETTYPVAEATSYGLLIVCSHIQTIIFTFMFEALSQPLTQYEKIHQKCVSPHDPQHNATFGFHGYSSMSNIHGYQGSKSEPKDMTVAMMVLSGIICFQSVALILFFKSGYRRLRMEKAQPSSGKESPSVNAEIPPSDYNDGQQSVNADA